MRLSIVHDLSEGFDLAAQSYGCHWWSILGGDTVCVLTQCVEAEEPTCGLQAGLFVASNRRFHALVSNSLVKVLLLNLASNLNLAVYAPGTWSPSPAS